MFLVNETIRSLIYLSATGLSLGDLSYTITKNGAASGLTPTLVEDSDGWYYFNFTPTTVGNYNSRVSYGDFLFTLTYPVRLHLLNEVVSNFLTNNTIGSYINKIKIYVRNKLVISSGNYTVYEDDNTTTHETGTVTTSERTPS